MIDLKQQREWAQKWADKGYVKIGICPKAIVELLDMLEAAQKDQARYQWLKGQQSLPLESSRQLWTREDGSTYHSAHYLAAGQTKFAELESLDATIDAAMAATKGEQA